MDEKIKRILGKHQQNLRKKLKWRNRKKKEKMYFLNERVMKKTGGIKIIKEEFTKSAASFCRQVAAWIQDIFSNFYLTKSHKTAKNSTTTKAREKKYAQIWNPYNFRQIFCRFD